MMLRVDNMNFQFNGHPVLSEVAFAVEKGEVLAILGPNGAGKTTLLRCLNGILKASSGTVMVDDENVLKLNAMAVARRVGYVAQHQSPGRLTVFDAILLGRRPHIRFKVSKEDLNKVDGAIRSLHMEPFAMRYIDQLSGGELQKVAVGRALVQEPRLLLLDEPTSSLDLKNQIEMLKLLRRVVKEHAVCAVMTLHDLSTALRFADKCVFLKNGGIFAAEAPQAVTADIIHQVYDIAVDIQHCHGSPVVIPK